MADVPLDNPYPTPTEKPEKPRKKPGAKPNPFITDMAAHRKEKNRQAQKALRERRSIQAQETQNELKGLRTQVATLTQERIQLRHENRQLQQLLALTFSSWLPEVAKEMIGPNPHDAVMIAARALAELRSGGAQPEQVAPAAMQHLPVSQPMQVQVPVQVQPFVMPPTTIPMQITQKPPETYLPTMQNATPPPSIVHPSPQPSPINSFGTPVPVTPPTSCCSTKCDPPAAVENCANTMPCFVLKEKILKYGRQIDLTSLCNELVQRAVCNGNPWDPADWNVPSDLFERYPCMK